MLRIYADGGVLARGRGTYWTVGVEDENNKQFRIVARCEESRTYRTSIEAECAAIREALLCLFSLPAQQVTLYSDCRAALEKVLRGGGIRSRKPARQARLQRLQGEIRQLWASLRELGHRISLCWLPRERMELRLGH
jgi:ribonuclease HI